MIAKEKLKEIFDLIKKQEKKDTAFADFMETYLDGRYVPTLNNELTKAFNLLFAYTIEGVTDVVPECTLIEWYIYETYFGENPLEATIGKKDFLVDSFDAFYDLLCEWEKHLKTL